MISVCDWLESIVGKGENAGYQHFLLFLQCYVGKQQVTWKEYCVEFLGTPEKYE